MPKKGSTSDGKEARLVEAARRGDSRSIEQLWRITTPWLIARIEKEFSDVDVEAAVQETWIKALKPFRYAYVGPGKFDPAKTTFDAFKAWLHIIARNVCRDVRRKEGKGTAPDGEKRAETIHVDQQVLGMFDEEDDAPLLVGEEHPAKAGGQWQDGPTVARLEEKEEARQREKKAKAVAKHVRQKGLKETKLRRLRLAKNWQEIVTTTLLKDRRNDARLLFEARRIMNHPGCERGILELVLATPAPSPRNRLIDAVVKRGADVKGYQLREDAVTLLIWFLADAARRARLRRRDPEWTDPTALASALSIQFFCGHFSVGTPLHSACAEFLNATFPRGKKWTPTRVRQTISRLGHTPEAIRKRAAALREKAEKKSRPS